MPDLPEVLDLFREYDEERLSRDSLEATLAERVLTTPVQRDRPPDTAISDARMLAYKLAEVVCGMTGPEEAVALFTRRVLQCVAQIADPGDILDLLPVIQHHDEFSVLVSKHVRGLITPSGMRSIIAKRFSFEALHPRLETASAEQLQAVCDLVESGEYQRLQTLLAVL